MSFGVLKNIGEGGMSKILRFPSLSYIVKTKNSNFALWIHDLHCGRAALLKAG